MLCAHLLYNKDNLFSWFDLILIKLWARYEKILIKKSLWPTSDAILRYLEGKFDFYLSPIFERFC